MRIGRYQQFKFMVGDICYTYFTNSKLPVAAVKFDGSQVICTLKMPNGQMIDVPENLCLTRSEQEEKIRLEAEDSYESAESNLARLN